MSGACGGQVEEIYIMKDKATGQSKGCAFVRFANTDAANAAIQGLHQKMTMPGATQPLIAKWADAPKPKQTNVMGMMGRWSQSRRHALRHAMSLVRGAPLAKALWRQAKA